MNALDSVDRLQPAPVVPEPANPEPPKPAPPAMAPFTAKIAIGLSGVLLAVLVSGFNEHVTETDLADLRGAMGIGYDDGTWLSALYEAFQVAAMAFAPWLGMTFGFRRVTVAAVGVMALVGVLSPFAPNLPALYLCRAVQGYAGGTLPPMLMTVALRYLSPGIKIWGLGAYALTATFGPNMGTPLAAFWFESFGWHFVFWEVVPFCLLAIVMVEYGLPQDPLRLERFRMFDWRGFLTGFPGICFLVIALMQGDRLDWFNSPVICHLMVAGTFLFALFLVNEWFHPMPFFRIQMLGARNIAFSLIAIALVLMMVSVTGILPGLYLGEVRGYRPLDMMPMSLALALPQLVSLPLVTVLCSFRRVDCRWVMATGLLLTAATCWAGTFVTSDWYRGNFILLQALQVFAQPLTTMPILMMVTLKLGPADGPFISGMFNMTKGLAGALAAAYVDAMATWREHTHSNILLDRFGLDRFTFDRLGPNVGPNAGAGGFETRGAMASLEQAVHAQSLVLTCADIYLATISIAGLILLLLAIVPVRVYPPTAVAR